MNNHFLTLTFLFLSAISFGQVYTGDITLATQTDVNNFSTNYPGITYIDGELIVGDGLGDFVTDLTGLSQLTGARHIQFDFIYGFNGWIPSTAENLIINEVNLGQFVNQSDAQMEAFTSQFVSLEQLHIFGYVTNETPSETILFENLISVDSMSLALAIPTTFPTLQTIDYFTYESSYNTVIQMPNVTTLHTLISLAYDNLITVSTPYFSSLSHIDSFVVFNSNVEDGFIGLSSLTTIGTFETQFSYQMTNVNGLTNVHTADIISLWGVGVGQLTGLESLQNVRRLTIASSNLSGDLSTLSNLQSVDTLQLGIPSLSGFNIGISGLTSLHGIENAVINDELYMIGPDLFFCNVPSVCNFLFEHGPEDYFIDATNPFGCASPTEILANCGDPSNTNIIGSIYFDANCNGVVDDNEFTLSTAFVEASPTSTIFMGTDNYFLSISPQTSVTLNTSNLPDYFSAANPITINASEFGGVVSNQNLLVCPAYNFDDIQISIQQFGNISPGFTSIWNLQIDNLGSTDVVFTPSFTINTPEFLFSVNPMQGSYDGNTITWAETTISPGETISYDFNISLLPTATILGEMFSCTAIATIVNGTDENPSNNTALFEQEIIGSYDPNDKVVNTPQINIETIDPTQPLDLTYRVRFQNTGTAPAVNVRVEDVLEEDLDPSTFQLLSSSHPVYYQIQGNQINFFFDNIMLPDSTSDPEGSIGTFFFRIKSNGNHTLESSIDNQVSIFFDFNEPIITNVASTIFYECTEVNLILENNTLFATEGFESYQWFFNGNILEEVTGNTISSPALGTYSVIATGAFECVDQSDEVEVISNINETSTTEFLLWPNPAKDILNIQTNHRGIVHLFDMQGKQVMRFTLNGETSIDLSQLPSGLYQMTSDTGPLGQFVKE